jgi:alkylresorcinol/alkylpyrone synthase
VSHSPRLIALATAVPPHVLRQGDVARFAAHLFPETLGNRERLLEMFEHTDIEQRHMCVPLDWFASAHDFAEKNDLYVENAVRLGAEVARRVLSEAGLEPSDVDHLVFVSSTGLATPSVDARLANTLGMREDLKRTPIWGLGCAGGAVGLSRAGDFARADQNARVLLIALELCSLTFQHDDLSKRNLVATSLFADGAAAALVIGVDAAWRRNGGPPPLELGASFSMLWRDTLDVMGWDVDGEGLHVVFSRDIPTIVHEKVRPSLDRFLTECGLHLDGLDHLVAHPGGAKVLRAYSDALALPPAAFEHAREVLRDYGNMSSPSCLFVLERFRRARDIAQGDHALVTALGPGFSAEYVLLSGMR